MYVNEVEIIGFTGAQPVVKKTPGGQTVANFSIATHSSWIKEGERQDSEEWHPIAAWGKLAEYAGTFKKGSHIRVTGRLRRREYDRANGTHVEAYEIVADSIINLRAGQRNVTPEPTADETA